MLVVEMVECCGLQEFVLDVPERTKLEELAWQKASAGVDT